MSREMLFDGSGSTSGSTGQFGVERGSGYEPKAIATQSPLVCPRCGKPCAGTAERKTCASCGVIGDSKRCNACGWTLQSEPASVQRRTLPVS
jgi:ribosomal protein L37E